MHKSLLNESMKIADLIKIDFKFLFVLSRFGVKLGVGEKNIAEICSDYGISVNLFLQICSIYLDEKFKPSCNRMGNEDLKEIADYIHASHIYYTQTALTKIDSMFNLMVSSLSENHHTILNKFYTDYRKEVDSHFEYEEKVVLPYIYSLLNKTEGNYHIIDFKDNHGDIEEKLYDLKNIIIKYMPEGNSSDLAYTALFGIFHFESDLNIHTRIENELLIPLAQKIEKNDK